MIDYYMPFADENLDAAMIDLKIGAIPDCLNGSIPSRHLGAKAGRVKYCFSVNDLCKNAEISYESSTIAVAGRNVVFATRPILFSAKKSWTTWALISACVLAIIVFAILKELPADSVLGSGTSQKIPGELASLFANYLTKYKTVFAALFTLANSLFTFFLVLLYNKGRNDK
ncbi:hypothetical protein SDC9_108914 [bioreactor metagenome]|uniref:Uncharacterized protein n=1 Tax=bioreactor metagenome TaxID=1076179 RepID=A0A645BAH2_9ZZZZ